MLLATIRARGILQPPLVAEQDGHLFIRAGERRTKFAIKAGLNPILVLETEPGNIDPIDSLIENLIRSAMHPVDIWRRIDDLEKQNPDWNEQAVADTLALTVRKVRSLKQLANIHSPMLDVMSHGAMPSEDQLRTMAAATRDEQIQVWKKYKPKKGHEVSWYEVARALAKRRMPFSAAKFGDDLARAYGVEWLDDLFVPAGEDGRYTTNVDGFFGAQQEWLQNNLPERGRLLPLNEYGHPELPKKAEHVHGKPGKNDLIGHYLDQTSGEMKTIVFRIPGETKPTKANKANAGSDIAPEPKNRPNVTQRGLAMIGDLRTDALHQALRDAPIDDGRLIALLVLALASKNVSVHSGADLGAWDRDAVRATITEGGVLTAEVGLIREAARVMLIAVLSCRDNMSNSGITARIAGEAIGSAVHLPTMATEEFLSCLSRQALEAAAAANGARIAARVKDTRANLVTRFKDVTYHYPGALFAPTADELKQDNDDHHRRGQLYWDRADNSDEDEFTGDDDGPADDKNDENDGHPDTTSRDPANEADAAAAEDDGFAEDRTAA